MQLAPRSPRPASPIRDRLITTCATLLNGIKADLPKPARPFLPLALAKLEGMSEAHAAEMATAICAFADELRPLLPPRE